MIDINKVIDSIEDDDLSIDQIGQFITRYFKCVWRSKHTDKLLVTYYRLGQSLSGYISKDELLCDLVERGEITYQDIPFCINAYELTNPEYYKAIRKCIKIKTA